MIEAGEGFRQDDLREVRRGLQRIGGARGNVNPRSPRPEAREFGAHLGRDGSIRLDDDDPQQRFQHEFLREFPAIPTEHERVAASEAALKFRDLAAPFGFSLPRRRLFRREDCYLGAGADRVSPGFGKTRVRAAHASHFPLISFTRSGSPAARSFISTRSVSMS